MSENRWYPEFKNGDYTGGIVNDHLGIYQKEKDYRSALVICEERNTAISETEALRQQLAAAQAENQHTNELLFAWQSWAQKTCEQMDDMPAVLSGLTKDIITQHIQDLQAENAQLKAALKPFADDWQEYLSNHENLSAADYFHFVSGGVNVEALQIAYNALHTPARETTVNRCPNCQEIFGEATEDGLLECSNCGMTITGGA